MTRAIGVLACLAVCWAATGAGYAQTAIAADDGGGSESLGVQLMDGLPVGPDLPAAEPATTVPGPTQLVGESPLDDEGEDIGGPSGPLPLVRVRYGMRTAQALLKEPRGVDRAGRVQDEVIAELDALIDELSKQCQSCSGACQKSGEKSGTKRRSPAGGTAAKIKPGHGNAPARDSNDRLDRASAEPVDAADVQTLLKRLWGHLPERVREQMLQSYSDEFLPAYELEIEKYYRRLAEEGDEEGSGGN